MVRLNRDNNCRSGPPELRSHFWLREPHGQAWGCYADLRRRRSGNTTSTRKGISNRVRFITIERTSACVFETDQDQHVLVVLEFNLP